MRSRIATNGKNWNDRVASLCSSSQEFLTVKSEAKKSVKKRRSAPNKQEEEKKAYQRKQLLVKFHAHLSE